jgi:hypothetical protein
LRVLPSPISKAARRRQSASESCRSQSVVVPAKAGTPWRVRTNDAGFPLPRERRSARSGVRAKDAGFPLPRERRSARSGKDAGSRASSSPRRRGPSGAFDRKTLGFRFRGNDGAHVRAFERKTLGSRFRGKDGAQVRAKTLGRERRRPREGGDPVARSSERRWVFACARTSQTVMEFLDARSRCVTATRTSLPQRGSAPG